MRIGQTSFIQFIAEILASAIGFLATIYFARVLGAEILGYYAVALAVVTWLAIGGKIGIKNAIVKRMSEGETPFAYFWAGASVIGGIFVVLGFGVFVFQEQVNAYVGAEVHYLIVFMLLASLSYSLFNASLQGSHLVHVYAVLKPLKIGGRAVVQIALVYLGYELTGMLVGYSTGWLMAAIIAVLVLTPRFEMPSRHHYRRLVDFAKYAWLGKVQGKTFSEMDILVLGALVSSALVGIYSIAWALCSFFLIFSQAVKTAMFPEISKLDAEGKTGRVASLTNDALAFGGFVLIPGIVGGLLIGDRVLAIYGEEFIEGHLVLVILLFGSLLFSYLKQLLNTLNGIDRPDVAFRVNGLFVGANVVANVSLVYAFGWVGAAIGTSLSAGVGLLVAVLFLRPYLDFDVPTGEIGRQIGAAALMAGVVYPAAELAGPPSESFESAAVTVGIVAVGVAIYTITLLVLSPRFRAVVQNNVPVEIPVAIGR